ncbi:hypothetical protein DY000_02026933 [Brassica cretica]|uniref:Uncharacterized protein n=1 Tax=Brassica cretica TaxID=69181 RepID=A0ABQ7EDN2_BRACR|nr:hypothetical protein DY000_02026933 [Brassica cretica]
MLFPCYLFPCYCSLVSMAGASSLQQAPDPHDPGADNLGSGSPLHPSQFPPFSHSPEAASKPQVLLPVLSFSP